MRTSSTYVYIYMYVCICFNVRIICIFECMYVCVCVSVHIYVCMFVLMYVCMYAATASGTNSPELNTSIWLSNAFQFCNISGMAGVYGSTICSMVTFNSFDKLNQQVSDYHYFLSNGSCANSFTILSSDW